MPRQQHRLSLRALTLAIDPASRFIADENRRVVLADRQRHGGFADIERMREKTVLLATARQLETVLALIELDGVAKRVLLFTPNLIPHLDEISRDAEVDVVVCDEDGPGHPAIQPMHDRCDYYRFDLPVSTDETDRSVDTEWVLFTSGTTGRPKMAVHTLASLTGPLNDGLAVPTGAVWSTFYDIRRYGGLTILFRALLGGASMVLSELSGTSLNAFLTHAGHCGVTHISGTPSHWRKVLMSSAVHAMHPGYIRMSGEIADQQIIDLLKAAYPAADVAHAFASTEAGFAFDVRDGLAGFPASYVDNPTMKAEMRVIDGTLWIRSARTASTYIGKALPGADGFIDTGDLVERVADRYYFRGRAEGVINVGGQKVFPEEVEAILAMHPSVIAAQVYGRRSPITGAVAAANLVLRADALALDNQFCAALRELCGTHLARWKIPVSFKQVETIQLTASGKIERRA